MSFEAATTALSLEIVRRNEFTESADILVLCCAVLAIFEDREEGSALDMLAIELAGELLIEHLRRNEDFAAIVHEALLPE